MGSMFSFFECQIVDAVFDIFPFTDVAKGDCVLVPAELDSVALSSCTGNWPPAEFVYQSNDDKEKGTTDGSYHTTYRVGLKKEMSNHKEKLVYLSPYSLSNTVFHLRLPPLFVRLKSDGWYGF